MILMTPPDKGSASIPALLQIRIIEGSSMRTQAIQPSHSPPGDQSPHSKALSFARYRPRFANACSTHPLVLPPPPNRHSSPPALTWWRRGGITPRRSTSTRPGTHGSSTTGPLCRRPLLLSSAPHHPKRPVWCGHPSEDRHLSTGGIQTDSDLWLCVKEEGCW
jgi:hypothetical protein